LFLAEKKLVEELAEVRRNVSGSSAVELSEALAGVFAAVLVEVSKRKC
jgi:hypothetical protein